DLFWAIRGGGGNFGVVTTFEYRLHPLASKVLAGNRVYPFAQARAVMEALREYCEHAPDEMTISASLTAAAPGVPRGRYIAFEAVYCGNLSEGPKVLEPLGKLGKPLFDNIAAKPYVQAQLGLSGASPTALPPGLSVYVKSGFLRNFSAALIDTSLQHFEAAQRWLFELGIGQLGGAMSRVKPEATAYWNRLAQYEMILDGFWTEHAQDQQNVKDGRALWSVFE